MRILVLQLGIMERIILIISCQVRLYFINEEHMFRQLLMTSNDSPWWFNSLRPSDAYMRR